MLRDCHVCLVGVLMSPFAIRADLLFSLSNWNGFMLCLVRERESQAAFDSLHCISLIKTLPVPPPKIFTYPCTQPPTPCAPLGVNVCMRDDFSSQSLGFFFLNKNRPAHKKKLEVKNMFCSLLLHHHVDFTLQL